MRAIACAAASLLAAAPAGAQQFDKTDPAGQVLNYVKMISTCELDGLADAIDPDVSSIGLRGAFAQSRAIYVQAVQAQCAMGVKLEVATKYVRKTQFGDMYLSVMEMKGSSNAGGQKAPLDLRVTLVLRRGADGVWRILHSQTATAF